MDQYKGGKGSDRQHWLNLWSTDEVIVDRKSRMGEPVILAKPFVSLFGGIQPAMLGELGAGTEDGLMDRFLFAYPVPRHVRFTEDEVSEEAEEEYAALYEKLADLRLATDEHGDPNPRPIRLTRRAKNLFAATVDSLGAETLQSGFPTRLEGVWAKLRGYLARLSLALAVCRCATSRVMEERVEHGDVEAASQLLDYFKAHARRVYAELGSPDPLEVLGADLRALIEEAGGRLEATATELHQALEEAGCEVLPPRPKELSQAVKALAGRSPALSVSFGHRGKNKVWRFSLAENSDGSNGSAGLEDRPAVATVATVARSEEGTLTSTPSADLSREDVKARERQEHRRSRSADLSEEAGTAPQANDGRSRFTL